MAATAPGPRVKLPPAHDLWEGPRIFLSISPRSDPLQDFANVTGPTLVDQLCWLLEIAERAGANPVRLRETADALVDVVLAQEHDPRHRRSIGVAARMAISMESMQRAGYSHGAGVAALRRRYGLSRSRTYALLALSKSRYNAGHNKR
jgi:hypothetical protein